MPHNGDIFVFDAFGTLFDVQSAARKHASAAGEKWPRLAEIWRAKQLEYSWIHAALGSHMPFEEATRQGLLYALHELALPGSLAVQMMPAYRALDPFPEVAAVLAALKARGTRLAILSNGDADVLSDLVENAKLDGVFDSVISVATAGTFKPNPRVYALACQAYDVDPADITFISSNRWDIAGACAFGFAPIWVNRGKRPDEFEDLPPRRVISDLKALVE